MASGNEINFFFNYIPPQPRSLSDKANVARWAERRAFYTCNDKNSYLSYMKTGSPKDREDYLAKVDYESLPNNMQPSYMKYMGDRNKTYSADEKSSGLFDRKGMLNANREKQHREALRANKGNIWSGVITFEKEFGQKHSSTAKQASEAMKKVFDKFLNSTHLSSKHIEWLGSLHENTEHYHIHYTFYEKEPYRLMKGGELKHSYKGNVEKEQLDYLKQSMFRYFTYSQINTYETRDKILSALRSDFSDISMNGQLFKDFKELSGSLKVLPNTAYKDLTQEQRKMVDIFSLKIIKGDSELLNHYTKTFSELAKADESIKEYDTQRGAQTSIKSRADVFREDLFARMGRVVLKNADYVSERMEIAHARINDVYASDLSDKAKSTSVRMIKKGLSKASFRMFRNLINESSGLVKNYHWLKILQDKEKEERLKNAKVY